MRIRPSARLVVLDDRDRVLLFKYEDAVALDPTKPNLRVYWATPGGGLEGEETFEQAARRELWEETGIEAEIGSWIWTREREFRIRGEIIRSHERYFLVRVVTSDVSWANLEPGEREVCRDHCWWSLGEMQISGEVLLPPGLPDLLAPILSGLIPRQPIDVDVC